MRASDIKIGALGRVPGLKIAAPQRTPAVPARPANWAALSPAEKRVFQLAAQTHERARDHEQAAARQTANLPSNWRDGSVSAIDRRAWMLEHGGKEFSK